MTWQGAARKCVRRGLGVLLILASQLAAPHAAKAGTYDVVACKGGPDNSWAHWADAGMAAYDSCPNNPSNMMSGLVTRASVGSGVIGPGQGAYQVFGAPAGASLAQMSFDAAPYRWEQHWTVGVVAFDSDFNVGLLPWGCYAGQPGCGIVPGSFFGPLTIGLGGRSQVRIEARCGNTAGCTVASSGYPPYTRATMAIANVSVRVQDFSQPALSWAGGGLLGNGWLRGLQGVSFDASDNVGIRDTSLFVDGHAVGTRGKPCDYSLRIPCPQGGDGYAVDTSAVRPDGAHTLTARVVDTAGNASQASRTILVDNTPPAQPEALAVEGGEGWRSDNRFVVRWRNPAEAGGSPIEAAHYTLCEAGGGNCQQGEVELTGGGSITFRMPASGQYVTRVWLRDAAGNEDAKTSGPPVTLRFDDQAPELAFEPQDPSAPTRVSASAADRASGVARGEIELRKQGSSAWHALATTLQGEQLSAYLDDESLPDGAYELRAHVVDRAGNERSTQLRRDGQPMQVTMPVRVRTHFRAGIAKRSPQRGRRKAKRPPAVKLLARARVGFGERARVSGSLRQVGGGPVANAQVLVFQLLRQDGARFSQVATLRTSASGEFSYLALAGPSRTFRFRYAGTAAVRPATHDVELLVRASSTLRSSQRFALNGETVTFKGRLRGKPLPASGKLVELQAYARGRWRTFATTPAGSTGHWRYSYRFDGTRGRQIYRFRARIPQEGTYPYEVGVSRRVKITVVGL